MTVIQNNYKIGAPAIVPVALLLEDDTVSTRIECAAINVPAGKTFTATVTDSSGTVMDSEQGDSANNLFYFNFVGTVNTVYSFGITINR